MTEAVFAESMAKPEIGFDADGSGQRLAAGGLAGQRGVRATSPAGCSRSTAARCRSPTAGGTDPRSTRDGRWEVDELGPAIDELIAALPPLPPVYGAS